LRYNGDSAFPPQERDLVRLYDLIVNSRSVTVLEFGCGYSTFVIGAALKNNEDWFDSLANKPKHRSSSPFTNYSLETNEIWASECFKKLFRTDADNNTYILDSSCYADHFMGQLCSFYNELPDIVPDFIYLDGPDPRQIRGSIHGLSWQCPERTPMAADILILESTLIPGTRILIDGRTNNARFLARNLKRKWKIEENREEDYTLMELDEPPLGQKIVIGADILRWISNNK